MRYGWACMGQSSAFAAAGRNLNAGGASQPVRNMAASASDGKDILYAKQRGLPDSVIRRDYLLRSIAQPFLTMLGMSVSLCVGGSVVIEKIFSISGMGSLLTEAVYTLD